MAGMQVSDFQHDCFQRRACVVFELKEPHPHVVCVVVDDEQAIAETMWGRDINWTQKVEGHVEKGTGWFRARSSVAGCNNGLVEQARIARNIF
jgi:hypothetical protein